MKNNLPKSARYKRWGEILLVVLFGAFASSRAAQNSSASNGSLDASAASDQSSAACSMIVTTRDAARCIGFIRPTNPIPTLDLKHTYTLPELIDIAETASPEGRIAWAGAKQSLERAGIDHAFYLPLITFVTAGSDDRVIIFPYPGPQAPRGYVTVEHPAALAQLEFGYSLLDFGRGARFDGSKALEIASTLRLSRTQQTIAYATSVQFYVTQQAMGHLAAARIILQTAETLLENAQLQYDNGRSTVPDVENAQAGAAEARFDLAAAVGEVKDAKLALTESIGVEPTAEIEVEPQQQNVSSEALDGNVDSLIQAAWKSRPDLLARAQELRNAHDTYRMAQSAYLPKVGLGGTGGETGLWPTANHATLSHATVSTWSVEIKLRWELFNGARSHEVSRALAEQRAAAEEQRATQDSVTRQVWQAYVDYQTAVEQQRSSQTFLSAAQTSYDSSLEAYNFGVRSLVDVVQAERQLAQARLAVVRSQAQLMQSAVALSYATGDLLHKNAHTTGVLP